VFTTLSFSLSQYQVSLQVLFQLFQLQMHLRIWNREGAHSIISTLNPELDQYEKDNKLHPQMVNQVKLHFDILQVMHFAEVQLVTMVYQPHSLCDYFPASHSFHSCIHIPCEIPRKLFSGRFCISCISVTFPHYQKQPRARMGVQ
jgi:hypothetical protein